jgi:membrane-bound serine protease (ClpP class)
MALVSRANSDLLQNDATEKRPGTWAAWPAVGPSPDFRQTAATCGTIRIWAALSLVLGLSGALSVAQTAAQAPASAQAPAADAAKPADTKPADAKAAVKPANLEKRLELGPNEAKVGKYIVIEAPIRDKQDDYVRQAVEQFVGDTKKQGKWPVLVFEIQSGHTEFGRAHDLAKYLTGEALNGATTIAYLPKSLTGHGVLVAAACNEIIMHRDGATEKTEIGDAGKHETAIDDALRAAYRQIAERRRTIPTPIILKMLDKDLDLLEVQTDQSGEFVLRDDLETLKKTRAVSNEKVIAGAGRVGLFTAAQARQMGFVGETVAERKDLVQVLGVPPEALEDDPSARNGWRPIRVDVTGAITPDLLNKSKRVIENSIRDYDANFICIWLDSAGGTPAESANFAEYLSGLDPQKHRTVAFIPRKARGDAAMIALGCDQIVLTPDAVIGGSGEAVIDGKEIGEIERTARDLAAKNFHPPALAAAFYNPDLVVYRYTRKDNGVVDYFTEADAAAHADAGQWIRENEIKPAGEPLTLVGERAVEFRIAARTVESFADFKALYRLDNDPKLLTPGWAQTLIDALNRPEIHMLLLLIGFMALYMELHTPGVGVGGFVAAVCFVLYFWAAHLGGTAGWLEVLLFVLGAICVLMEIFVFPGVGIFGLGGGLLVITSLILASQTYVIPRNDYQMNQLRSSLLAVVGAIVGTGVAASIVRRFLPHTPMFNRVYLAPPSGDELTELSQRESLGRFEHLRGATGTCYTPLVPGGKVRFDEELVDVVSEGDFIDRGTTVEVVEVQGTRVVVRQSSVS